LGVGLADALIVGLSKIGGLRLRPTASVMAYANIEVNAVEAGRDLKVAIIVDDKIKQIGEGLCT
jgi:TolB-like protein